METCLFARMPAVSAGFTVLVSSKYAAVLCMVEFSEFFDKLKYIFCLDKKL
jgi:hypothetical protein